MYNGKKQKGGHMKFALKNILIPSVVILLAAIPLTLMNDAYQAGEQVFSLTYANSLFIITIIGTIIGGFLFVDQMGLFNGIRFSMKYFRASTNKHYATQLMDEYNKNDSRELKEYLKEEFLYKRNQYDSTYMIFIPSIVILILTLIYVGVYHS